MGDQAARSLTLAGARTAAVTSWWHEPEAAAEPPATVVLAHGAGGSVQDPALVAACEVIASTGHRAVRVNLPYRELRPKGPPPRAESCVADWASVRDAVVSRVGTPVVIGGKSYGGRVATMLAAQDPTDVEAVLCLSYPLHPPGRPDRLRVEHLQAINVPVMVVQGTSDPFGTPSELAEHLPQATIVAVAGGDHGLHVARTRSPDGRTHGVREQLDDRRDLLARFLAPGDVVQ